jgi:hypothetical protein
VAALPERAELIHWAARRWYEGGTEAEPDRLPQATEFVEEVTGRIAAAATPKAHRAQTD